MKNQKDLYRMILGGGGGGRDLALSDDFSTIPYIPLKLISLNF